MKISATSSHLSTKFALSALALSTLLSSIGTSIANVALPTLSKAFEASFPAVQWITLIYLLAITILIVSVGKIGDLLGHKKVLLFGIILFTLASFLCGLAPTLWVLIAARSLQGIGAAILLALTVAFISEIVLREKIGSAMGLLGTMSAIGTAMGPTIGGFLIAESGWRSIFLLMVPLGLLNIFLAYRYLPADKKITKANPIVFDNWGTVLLAITLASYTLAVTIGGGHLNRSNLILIVVAVIAGILFVAAEKKATSPLIQLTAFRNSELGANLSMNALVATVMMSTLIVGPFYLSGTLGLNAAEVGIIMSIGPILSIFSGIIAGNIVDRWGARPVVNIGLIEMAVGSILLATLPSMFGVIGYIIAIAILSPGYQLFQAANNTIVMTNVAANQRGVISGILSLSRNLGLITGASVMGSIFAVTGLQITFAMATILILIALLIAARNKRTVEPDPSIVLNDT